MLPLRPVHMVATILASSTFLSTPAFAQVATAQTDAAQAAEVDATAEDTTQEIVVTGSLIARAKEDVSVPVVTIGREELDQSGKASLDEIMTESPQMGVGFGSSNAFFNYADPGASFANLRSLGTNRSLVLVNGRRRVSSSRSSSAVDMNTIPPSMIERTEIISGGASATYGADAVSGVINIITRKKEQGIRATFKAGISEEGDTATYSANLAGGTKFADGRGQLNVGYTYSKRNGIYFPDRKFSDRQMDIYTNPLNTGPNDGIPDTITYDDVRVSYITPDVSFWGPNSTANGKHYLYQNGQIVPVTGDVISSGYYGTTNGGNVPHWYDYISLVTPLEVHSTRADLTYELTDKVRFFGEFEYANSYSDVLNQDYRFDTRDIYFNGLGGPRITRTNPYLPAAVRDLMVQWGYTYLPVRKKLTTELGELHNIHERETMTIVGGLEGEIGARMGWRLSHQRGEFIDNVTSTNLIWGSRFIEATTNIVSDGNGGVICASAAARAQGCVPVNLWVTQPFSQEQRDYFVRDRHQRVKNTQDLTTFTIGGNLFDLPHGPVGVAFGFERRRETLSTRDDELALSGELTFFGVDGSPNMDESFEVYEGYGEISAPVLGNLPLIKKLTVEGALRLSDYSTIGGTTAWRLGANWEVNDDVRLRLVRATSVRAPNLYELNQPMATTSVRILDACTATTINNKPNRRTNCQALGLGTNGIVVDNADLTTVYTGGNKNLQAETSTSWTAGVSFKPSWLPGMFFKIDYYNIKIDGAVSSFTAQQYVNNCFDASTINNPFCGQLSFDDNGLVNEVRVGNINVAKMWTSAIDVGMDYYLRVGSSGGFKFNVNAAYLFEKRQQIVPDDEATLQILDGEYWNPELLMNTSVQYLKNGWAFTVKNRFIAKSRIDRQSNLEYFDKPYVNSRFYTDTVVFKKLSNMVSLYVGVNNVFNVTPPNNASTYIYAGVYGGSRYDSIGRYYFSGLNLKF